MKSIAQLVTGVDYEFIYLALHNRVIGKLHILIKRAETEEFNCA